MSLIYKQIPLIMSEVGAIEKNRSGEGIRYKFRGIDDIYSALQPLLAKYKVFFAPNVLEQKRESRETKSGGTMTFTVLTVEYTFFAEDASFFKLVTVGEAMDTSDKSSNKAMSAALKYAMLQLFCIPTEEEKDTEYSNHSLPKRSPVAVAAPAAVGAAPAAVGASATGITEAQRKRMFGIAKTGGWSPIDVKELLSSHGIASTKDLTIAQYDELCSYIEKAPKPVVKAPTEPEVNSVH